MREFSTSANDTSLTMLPEPVEVRKASLPQPVPRIIVASPGWVARDSRSRSGFADSLARLLRD
ncbi:MAG: hypothetical protein ACYC1I_08530 [Acidimicrobiales bacterium]